MGSDRVRESERAGKKGRAIAVDPAEVEEAVPCGICGEPLIEGANGSLEPRGSYHRGCIRWARRMALGERAPGDQEPAGVRRRKRRRQTMGRRPEPWVRRMRPAWVYVGAIEAAVLGEVSDHQIERWIASGELVKYHLDGARSGGRPRNLYRLDAVLALVRAMRR